MKNNNADNKRCVREVRENGVKVMGCENYIEQCVNTQIWNGEGSWIEWVQKMLDNSTAPSIGGPRPGSRFDNMEQQQQFLLGRDSVTTRTQLRNNFAAAVLPGFTESGYKAVPIPEGLYKELMDFYYSRRHDKKNEGWNSEVTIAIIFFCVCVCVLFVFWWVCFWLRLIIFVGFSFMFVEKLRRITRYKKKANLK